MGTRIYGIFLNLYGFFAGFWCALNRNSPIFSVIFTFSSLQPALKACIKKKFSNVQCTKFYIAHCQSIHDN